MSKRLKNAAVVAIAVFAAAQLIRPDRTNPPTDASRTIQAHVGPASAVAAVLDRSCRDCHSNNTVWPKVAGVAPLSWLMASAVSEGRKVVNFSEWGGYSSEQQQALLVMSCRAVSEGKMPGAYSTVRPDTRLSAQDVETICAAARQTHTTASLTGESK
jgi:hypothetical protein